MGNRDTTALLAYHEETKHSVVRLRQSPHALDWEIMPLPFKVYPDLEPIALPRDFESAPRPALAAIADPGAAGTDGPRLDRRALARLLYFSAGVLRRRTYPGGEIHFRAAACTGALYHVDLYLVCGPLRDLEAGVYHFGPHDFALRRLRTGDHRAALIAASGNAPAVATVPVALVFTTTFWRNAWKYRARAYRHAFWDSGTLLANLLAVAAATALPARVVLGFADAPVNALLDLDASREVAIGLVPIGCDATPAPPSAAVPSLGLAVLPYSSEEVDYPAIRAAHAASTLDSGDDATAWRGPLATQPAPPATEVPIPLPPSLTVGEPNQAVIVRRGSARAFARTAIPLEALATVLHAATAGIPTDWLARDQLLADLYLIVHAVDGLTPGAYAYDRASDGLVPLRAGEFRREAGHLGLGQELPADAAVNLYWLADLDPVLAHFGNRGYRAVQLEAAIAGGRAYLAAYALRLGATGLTFFDDDVTRFLSPHAAGKSVLFLTAIGRPARRTAA